MRPAADAILNFKYRTSPAFNLARNLCRAVKLNIHVNKITVSDAGDLADLEIVRMASFDYLCVLFIVICAFLFTARIARLFGIRKREFVFIYSHCLTRIYLVELKLNMKCIFWYSNLLIHFN